MALRPGLILSISLLQVVLCFLSLAYAQTSVTTNATAGERHSEEYCAMYGICGKRSDGKYLNCPFGSPSVKPDDLLSSKVQSLCPTITGNVCCTETQFDTLRSQVQQAIPFLVGCPACLRNFLNLFCELTCSPSQSLFINVTSVAKLLNVYAPKYETGGRFWPTVHNSTIFSLVLMHVIAIGIFGLKKLSLASSLTVPLPILTLLFNEYCRKRFLPIFKDYPFECLIKKDREDQNDPTIAVFYDKLRTAYKDPALMPKRHPRSTDDHNSPLLQAGV